MGDRNNKIKVRSVEKKKIQTEAQGEKKQQTWHKTSVGHSKRSHKCPTGVSDGKET